MTKYLLFLTVLASSSAFAAEGLLGPDQRFSFEGAKAAFESAQPPDAAGLVGMWLFVGRATIPPADSSEDGYWPDGKFPIQGQSGFFFYDISFAEAEKEPDAFGNVFLVLTAKLLGAETGRVYDTFTREGRLTETGFRYPVKGNGIYTIEVNCKVVQKTGVLLCENKYNDSRAGSRNGKVFGYEGLVRRP